MCLGCGVLIEAPILLAQLRTAWAREGRLVLSVDGRIDAGEVTEAETEDDDEEEEGTPLLVAKRR